jgi:hypothetical protein
VELGPPLPLRSRNPFSCGRAQRAFPAAASRRCFGGSLGLQLATKFGHLRIDLLKLVLIAH